MGAPHTSFLLSKKASLYLLSRGGLFVRNDYDFDTSEKTCFWYIIKDSFGGMEELSTKVRNQVRRALKTLDIKIIEKEKILEEGYAIFLLAYKNYKIKSNKLLSEKEFVAWINSCGLGYQFWGCFDKESRNLVAFSVNHIFENQCNYEAFKANPKYFQGYYPFYGLLYEMNRYYLEEMKLLYVCDGARSITEHSNIQPFLEEKFKFRKAYCKLLITYTWWFEPFIKILFPFRNYIHNIKIKSLLYQETMARRIR